MLNIFGTAYPLDFVADFFDGVDEAADVACDVVEQVHFRHSA